MKTATAIARLTALVMIACMIGLILFEARDRPADPGTELAETDTLKINPSTNDPLLEVLYYLLAERQEQEAMYSAMVERIDQDSDMVIEAIPEIPGLQLDQAEWEGQP